jgi:hypothetical protein
MRRQALIFWIRDTGIGAKVICPPVRGQAIRRTHRDGSD